MNDLESILDTLEKIAAELPETISLDDVKHHPALKRLAVVTDDIGNRFEYRALEWSKSC